ncbi:MAG: hypothetical protein VX874_21340 [Pseudomonadota bacterium]|nr:hypothetical protein [Pseudomonadota bacterium]
MKVTTETPDLLIVDDRPVLFAIILILFILVFVSVGFYLVSEGMWAGLIFGAFGGGLGLTAYALFVRRVQVVFHRPEGWVELRRKSLFSTEKVRHALSEISHAELDILRGSGTSNTWRVVLVIPEGESVGHHPVTLAYSNGPGHQRCKDTINRWLGVE